MCMCVCIICVCVILGTNRVTWVDPDYTAGPVLGYDIYSAETDDIINNGASVSLIDNIDAGIYTYDHVDICGCIPGQFK